MDTKTGTPKSLGKVHKRIILTPFPEGKGSSMPDYIRTTNIVEQTRENVLIYCFKLKLIILCSSLISNVCIVAISNGKLMGRFHREI